MYKINDSVYFVNDLGYISKDVKVISDISNTKIILTENFIGKRGKNRIFENHVDRYLASEYLFFSFEEAKTVSEKRKYNIENKIIPFSVGDTISWNNGKYIGVISSIEKDSYIVHLPMRTWGLYCYSLDIKKLN